MSDSQYAGLAKCMIECGLFDDIIEKADPPAQKNPLTKSIALLYHKTSQSISPPDLLTSTRESLLSLTK